VKESKHQLNWMPVFEAGQALGRFNPSLRYPESKVRRDIEEGKLPVASFARNSSVVYLVHEEDLQEYLMRYGRVKKGIRR
jgi:hypothetical protein